MNNDIVCTTYAFSTITESGRQFQTETYADNVISHHSFLPKIGDLIEFIPITSDAMNF